MQIEKRARGVRGLQVIGLTASLSMFGCGDTPSSMDEQPELTDGTGSPLYSFPRPWGDGYVYVCWDPSDGDNPGLLAKARRVLEKSWSSATNVIFVGWDACDYNATVSGPMSMVALHFVAGSSGLTPLGSEPVEVRPGAWRPGVWNVTLRPDDPDRYLQQYRYEVVHEFGHVIGFGHEQNRPNNFDAAGAPVFCPNNAVLESGTYQTDYDGSSVMNYCATEPLDASGPTGTAPFRTILSAGDIAGSRQVYGSAPAHGFMITSDANRGLALNAWGGAAEGTLLRLHEACATDNKDCTWSYEQGMLRSDRDPRLAINAWYGAREGAELRLTAACTVNNPDCTWTYKNGQFVSDRDPGLAINATDGAVHGTVVHTTAACNTYNRDCTWTLDDVMLSSARDTTLGVNAWNGATDLGPLGLHVDCAQNNPDCTFTISGGLLLSSRNNLAMGVSGTVADLATVLLRDGCDKFNPDCTWTWSHGELRIDRDPSLALNALYGGLHGASLVLNQGCAADNRDCVFSGYYAR